MIQAVQGRSVSVVLAAWGALVGILPHALHHIGPIAGAALISGAGGKILFGGIGLLAAAPFLLRLYRRFRTWIAPAAALAFFALMFSLSSFVIGPALSDDEPDHPHVVNPEHTR